GIFTHQGAEIEEFCPAHATALQELDFDNVRGGIGKNPLHANAVGDLPNRKSLTGARTPDLEYASLKVLDPLLGSLNDFVGNDNAVAGFEVRESRFDAQLLVHVFN